MNLFKSAHFPKDIILLIAMRWYLAYPLSYRHVEELLLERGVKVDHATINRWVIRYSQDLERRFRRFKQKVGKHWYVDETYIKAKGQWVYYYRAVDQYNHTVDFYLSEKRAADAARRFFEQAIHHYHDFPNSVTLDNNPANVSGLDYVNRCLPPHVRINVRQNKYLNNWIEQDHRAIKRLINPMLSFKAYHGAVTTLRDRDMPYDTKRTIPRSNKCPTLTTILSACCLIKFLLIMSDLKQNLRRNHI